MPKILEMSAAVAVNAVGEMGEKKKTVCIVEEPKKEQTGN